MTTRFQVMVKAMTDELTEKLGVDVVGELHALNALLSAGCILLLAGGPRFYVISVVFGYTAGRVVILIRDRGRAARTVRE